MIQARKKVKRVMQSTRSDMLPEEQHEGLRSQEEIIEEVARETAFDRPRNHWRTEGLQRNRPFPVALGLFSQENGSPGSAITARPQ